jgi:hypothetical protein
MASEVGSISLESPRGSWVRLAWSAWAVVAAFGTYFCMYAFRKPLTAASFAGPGRWGVDEKTILVTAQVLGYTLAKFLGITVVAEIDPAQRATAVLGMVAVAEIALLGFGLAPSGLGGPILFVNGLALGMVFGMVLGFLEGRRQTEALTAGLCASFILADGFTKSVGSWLLAGGVAEHWMPAVAGLIFVPPLLVFVGMLRVVPPPDALDQERRSVREPMRRADRRAFWARYGRGLLGLIALYLLVTILRSIRADFAPEIWRCLGKGVTPALFTQSELLVALGVLLLNALCVLIADNRAAFFTAIGIAAGGLALVGVGLLAVAHAGLDGFWFMVLTGLGLYLPYVAVHTTIFERLLAMTRDRGNIGYLMYLADAAGYLGYVVVMLAKGLFRFRGSFLGFYSLIAWTVVILSIGLLAQSAWWFARRSRRLEQEVA